MSHVCVVGLAYGDEGKGTVVNRLCAEGDVSAVVRFNGGCQAAHTVLTDDDRVHTFAQFGSGTFFRVPTFLSKYMLVEPLSLMVEAQHLEDVGVEKPLDLLYVSPNALVTTPYHWLLNRRREELRGTAAHGTCGRGVGATAEYALSHADALRVVDLTDDKLALEKLTDIRAWAEVASGQAMPSPESVLDRYYGFRQTVRIGDDSNLRAQAATGRLVFEGAQGILLDEDWGWHPHTTWSHTTPKNARALCEEFNLGTFDVVGVTRAYTTRHGAGPFVAEDASLDFPEPHNGSDGPQGAWRVGHFDGVALDYATRCLTSSFEGRVSVYVTHLDSAEREPNLRFATSYWGRDNRRLRLVPHWANQFKAREEQTEKLLYAKPYLERPRERWEDVIPRYLGVPLYGVGRGPKTSDGSFMTTCTPTWT